MQNCDKIILDLCAGTGAWSEEYRKAGYDVRLVTTPGTDVRYYNPPPNVYGILAAPPCTQFSYARTTAEAPRDFIAGLEVVYACKQIVDQAYLWHWRNGTIKNFRFLVLENPDGYLVRFLGKPAMTFHPYQFGDPWRKKTCLWGIFNPPKENPVEPTMKDFINRPELFVKHHRKDRAAVRAKTPPGFARAFYEANR